LIDQGRHPGGKAPFGYRIDKPAGSVKGRIAGKLVPDEAEAPIVQKMFELAVDGLSTTDIGERLDALGMPPRGVSWRGRPSSGRWQFGTVYDRLTDEAYIGRWKYGKRSGKRGRPPTIEEPLVVAVPPLVSEETFRKAQETLKRNALEATRNAKELYLLRGRIRCGNCGEPYTGSVVTRRNGKRALYYKNRYQGRHRRPGCHHPFVQAAFVEERVWADLAQFIDDPDSLRRIVAEQAANPPVDRSAELARLEARAADLRSGEKRLAMVYAQQTTAMSEEAFTAAMKELAEQRKAVEGTHSALAHEQEAAAADEVTLGELAGELVEYRKVLRNPTWPWKRRVVERFLRGVEVTVQDNGRPAVRARYAFNPTEKCSSFVVAVITSGATLREAGWVLKQGDPWSRLLHSHPQRGSAAVAT